jgi:8-oxo-dGTP pyrophosphatase MutT (NUDIX family)
MSTATPLPRLRCFGGIIRHQCQTGKYEYVVIKGRRTAIWSFPKGHQFRGEDGLTCARREIREETGIAALPAPIRPLKIGGGSMYLFEAPERYPVHQEDEREVEEVRWCSLEELEQLPHVNKGIQQWIEQCHKYPHRM